MTTGRKEAQHVTVLRHLRTGTGITDELARELFGIKRIAARICEIKGHDRIPCQLEAGEKIVTERLVATTFSDAGVEYRLEKDSGQNELPLW